MPYGDDDDDDNACADICSLCISWECVCHLVIEGLLLALGFFICFCLSFQNRKPVCHVVDFYVPALNTFSTTNHHHINNTFVFFDIKLENVMPFNGLLYDNLNLTLSYGPHRQLRSKIGSVVLPGFYQGMRKTAHRRDVANTRGVPWAEALGAVSENASVVFRVDLATEVRSKSYFWYMKKQRVVVGGDVRVGGSGVLVGDTAVLLKSAAARIGCFQERVWILVVFSIFLQFLVFSS